MLCYFHPSPFVNYDRPISQQFLSNVSVKTTETCNIYKEKYYKEKKVSLTHGINQIMWRKNLHY